MTILIIVDPQNDFITGTLPVAHSQEAMHQLAEVLPRWAVDQIYITLDWHPRNHVSFEPYGGIWPPHCVRYTVGAAIEPKLQFALASHPADISFLTKGKAVDKDEYSAFADSYPDALDKAEKIYLCGIAGNVCVLNSLKDLAQHGLGKKLVVVEDASPSLDDGSALREMVASLGVATTKLCDILKD